MRLEILPQGRRLPMSQSHAYEPELAGLMLGGKDTLC